VLVTSDLNAKIIDMGVATDFGVKRHLQGAYMAPEVFLGVDPLGPEVDYWGLGLIMHMIYNEGSWNLIGRSKTDATKVSFNSGMPCDQEMPMGMKDVMNGLLTIEPEQRSGFDDVRNSQWFAETSSKKNVSAVDAKTGWLKAPATTCSTCSFCWRRLAPYR
jgi:serine/threonine protein kinase